MGRPKLTMRSSTAARSRTLPHQLHSRSFHERASLTAVILLTWCWRLPLAAPLTIAVISAQSMCNKFTKGGELEMREGELKETQPLTGEELRRMDAYWRAANYLSVGQIYLYDNPLLREPLKLEHVKPRLLGHWGTTPGQNFVYVHLNRVIKQHDLSMIYVSGPGHGGP